MFTAPLKASPFQSLAALLLVALLASPLATSHLEAAQGSTNYAVLLDGSGDHVDLDARALGTPSSITLELWTRIDRSGKLHFLVTNALVDFNDGFGMIVTPDNYAVFLVRGGTGIGAAPTSTTALELGEWYHLAGTYDSATGMVKLYVNGVQEASEVYSRGIFYHGARDLLFGSQKKWFGRSSRYLAGAIDEVRVWNYARAPEEISAAMTHELSGSEAGLIGYWQMNEGVGTMTADGNGAGNDGKLKEDATWTEAPWRVAQEIVVALDLKPGSGSNRVQIHSRGKLPVALLGSSEFDVVDEVDRSSLTFGATGDEDSLDRRGFWGKPNCGVEDVNDDGISDLVCKFDTQKTGIEADTEQVTLRGQTEDGMPIIGQDHVNPLSPGFSNKGNGSSRGQRGRR